MDVAAVGKQPLHGLLHVRVQVHGVYQLDIRPLSDGGEGAADALEPVAKALASVAGDEDEAFFGVEEAELCVERRAQGCVALDAAGDVEQRVDHCVAGDVDAFRCHALAQQAGAGDIGGGEMQVGDGAGQAAVHLLGPGRERVAGAQAGLDMPHRNARVKRGERGGEGGGGIAVDQHAVRLPLGQNPAQAEQHIAGDVRQILPRLHEVEVVFRRNIKQRQHLIQHLPVLGGDADARIDAIRRLQGLHHRRHFDGLGAGAEYDENFLHACASCLSVNVHASIPAF